MRLRELCESLDLSLNKYMELSVGHEGGDWNGEIVDKYGKVLK